MRSVGARSEGHCSSRFAEGRVASSEKPLVSSDIVASAFSAIFDAPLTGVVDGTQVQVVPSSNDEWRCAKRLRELEARVLVDQPVLAR